MSVLKELWKDKPLLITVVVGVIAIIFILYKNSKSSLVASDSTGTDNQVPKVQGGTYVEESYNIQYSPSTMTTTTTTTTPPPAAPPPPVATSTPKATSGPKWQSIPAPKLGDGWTFSQIAQFWNIDVKTLQSLNPNIYKGAELKQGWKLRTS